MMKTFASFTRLTIAIAIVLMLNSGSTDAGTRRRAARVCDLTPAWRIIYGTFPNCTEVTAMQRKTTCGSWVTVEEQWQCWCQPCPLNGDAANVDQDLELDLCSQTFDELARALKWRVTSAHRTASASR